jgi:RNA polymerase sigma factor for flagellar operon FliA
MFTTRKIMKKAECVSRGTAGTVVASRGIRKTGSVARAEARAARSRVRDMPRDSAIVLARFNAEVDLVDLLARQMVRVTYVSTFTLDDLRSAGREGLLRAARTFDEARGVPFRRWANLRIRGAMIDGLRRWGGIPRSTYRALRGIAAADHMQERYDEEDAAAPASTPQAADKLLSVRLAGLATAIAVGRTVVAPSEGVDSEGPTPEDLLSDAELIARVKGLVTGLPTKERVLIERHYFRDQTLVRAARSLGLSKSWASRLHARAIQWIALRLQESACCPRP